jgi:chondroitin synthase
LAFAQPETREALCGNDYDWLLEAARDASRDEPGPAVSLVIPVYDRRTMLARTLAALAHQTWPRERMQIVVADDGSRDGVEAVIERWRDVFDLVHVRQEDRGYRLARVRNLAARAVEHDALVQLDCDCIPAPGLVEAYARLLATSDRAVLLGRRRFVDAEALDPSDVLADPERALALPDLPGRVEWRDAVYAASDDLRREPRPHRCVVGCNLALSRGALDAVGGWCEAFESWGREDSELGYRLENAGHWFVPVPEATVLHQEPPEGAAAADARRRAGRRATDPILERKNPYFRRDHGRRWEVPLLTVLVPGGDEAAMRAVRRQTLRDLEVVAVREGDEDAAVARSDAPYLARVPAGVAPEPEGLARLVATFDGAPEGALACGGAPDALRAAWDAASPSALRAWLEGRLLLFRKRHWSRARWLAGRDDALGHLARVTALRVASGSEGAG